MKKPAIYFQLFSAAFVLLNFTVSGAGAKNNHDHAAKIYAPVVVAEAPTNEATLVKLPDGELKIFYIAATKDKVKSITSRDNGFNWGAPEVEFTLPAKAYYAIQAIVDAENELHTVFHIRGKGDNGYRGIHYNLWHCKTTGSRKEWTKPKEFFQGYVGSIRGFMQLRSGRMLVPVAIAIPARAQKPQTGPDYGWHDIVTFYSDDDGQTWTMSTDHLTVVQDNRRGLTRYGGIEPDIIELKDGRVWMLARTKNGFLYESFSDDGNTWSDLKVTQFINSDSPAALTRLKDGRIVLLFNSCQRWDNLKSYAIGGRETLHALISDDEGKSWHGFREIMKTPEDVKTKGDRGTAYAEMVQTDSGKLLVVSGQGEGQRSILLFDPDWLMEKKHRDDFSDGTSKWATHGSQTTGLIENPEKQLENVLYIHKESSDAIAGGVFNFPMFKSGSIQIRIKPVSGNGQMQLALTDHFSVVDDTLANQNAIFSFDANMKPGQWNNIIITWNSKKASLTINDNEVNCVAKRQMVWGVNYLRLCCPKESAPCGFYVKRIFFLGN